MVGITPCGPTGAAIGGGPAFLIDDLAVAFSDPPMAWTLEAARICLVIFGNTVGGWTIGFGMGYRRGIRGAMTGRVFNADHRFNGN